jgi:LPXTG-motif cell wall-anchored protein
MRLSHFIAAVTTAGASVLLAPAAFAADPPAGSTGYGAAGVPGAVLPSATGNAGAPATGSNVLPAVVTNTPAKSAGALPLTGSDVTMILTIGAGSVAVGAGLVIASRRRQRAAV